jgi:hypothetical protein
MQPSDFDGWVAGNAGGELLKPAATETLQVSRESVSFTDMKTGINILGTLQFPVVLRCFAVIAITLVKVGPRITANFKARCVGA